MGLPAFEVISHTADIGLLVRGGDIAELMVNGGHALNAIMFREPPSGRNLERDIRIDSAGPDTLLVDWLNELLYMFAGEQLVFSRFTVREVSTGHAAIRCEGEEYDASRHHVARDVKAATYHMAGIRSTGNGYEAQVILDV